MPTVRSLIEHMRRAVEGDGELLGRFVECRDERALAALIERHGPMVWGVCRRLLSHHDAEDAFQVTFIVLARKAASVKPREMVGNWLYGVARQAALQARTARCKEIQVTQMPDVEAPQDRLADVRPILDEELSRLPDHYRAVIVLCDLEGRTRKEVARQFSCPEGTVASRLTRAREMLAKRLTQRGVALSVAALAAVFSQKIGSAGVPASVLTSTIKAASLCGKAVVSLKVAALTEGVLKAMLVTKLKAAVAVVLVLGFLGAIGFGIASGQQKEPDKKQASEPKTQKGDAPQMVEPVQPSEKKDAVVKEKAEMEDTTAWGEEVDGLQAGLLAEAATCRLGEQLKFTLKLRNVGKAEVTITYRLLEECAPQVTNGGKVSVFMPAPKDYYAVPIKRAIKPGETITLYKPEVAMESEAMTRLKGLIRVETPTISVAPGKYKIAYGGMIQSHPKLATGTVEFEVKPAESVTAWGEEQPGGIQIGLGYLSGEKRVYSTGESVTLVVRARSVGRQDVQLEYVRDLWINYPPTIIDGDEKKYPMPKVITNIIQEPSQVTLKAGKETDLYTMKLELRPAGEADDKQVMKIFGTGKFQIHEEFGLIGRAWVGENRNAATDRTLPSGKLEIEVKEPGKVKQEKEKDAVTAWGKEVGGLQAGLTIAEKRVYSEGETVKLVIRVRNVGKEAVKFRYCREFFFENPPTVTDGKGKPVALEHRVAYGFAALVSVDLAPGKEIEVGERQLELKPTLYGTGKFQIQYERLETPENDKTLSKLATGKLELEVKEAEKP